MVWYHTIRAFLTALILFPFWIIGSVLDLLGFILTIVGGWLVESYDYRQLNMVKTYEIVKKNIDSGEFHKWTGKRIK